MDNALIRQQVEAWIHDVTGIDPSTEEFLADIFWAHRPEGWHKQVYAMCQIPSPQKIGQDALRYIENPTPSPGREIIPVVTGNRKITLTVTFWSYVNRDYEDALYYAGLLDNSLSLPEHQETLRVAGLGYETTLTPPEDISQMTAFGGPYEREMSGSLVSFRFHNSHRLEGAPTTYISQWGIESFIRAPDGTLLPDQIEGLLPPS